MFFLNLETSSKNLPILERHMTFPRYSSNFTAHLWLWFLFHEFFRGFLLQMLVYHFLFKLVLSQTIVHLMTKTRKFQHIMYKSKGFISDVEPFYLDCGDLHRSLASSSHFPEFTLSFFPVNIVHHCQSAELLVCFKSAHLKMLIYPSKYLCICFRSKAHLKLTECDVTAQNKALAAICHLPQIQF